MRPDLSIVVSVLDEEDSIHPFVDAIDSVIPLLDIDGFEFVFVDDGSSDSTWDVLCDLAKYRNDVVALRLVRNVGKENALTAGLAAASGRAHVPMDVDLQDPPRTLIELIEEWRQGAENVLARRRRRHDSWIRRIGGAVVYQTLGQAGDIEIPKDVGDFRLMSEQTTRRVLELPERSRFNKGLFALVTGRTAVVEYERPAARSEEIRGPRQSVGKLTSLATNGVIAFSTLPLFLLSLFGFLILGISAVATLLTVLLRALNILEVPGQATVVVLVALLLGFQALSVGILGLYVGQILEEVKRRPLFSVAEAHGLDKAQEQRLEAVSKGTL